MSSLSFLRSLALVLLMGAAAEAQSIIVEEPPLTFVPPAPTALTPAAHVVNDAPNHVFGDGWLGLRSRPSPYKTWFTAEYLLIWLNESNTPPLVTSSGSGVPIGVAAVIGQPTTSTRIGGNTLDSNPTSGLRFSAGTWFQCDCGFELSGFVMADRTKSQSISATGATDSIALGRPIISTASRSETVLYTAFANRFAGAASADQNTSLWGIEANGLLRLTEVEAPFFFALLGGVRYLDFDQSLTIQNTTSPLGDFSIPIAGLATIVNPNSVRITDSFETSNRFIGPQIGLRSGFELGRLGLGLGFKVAFGPAHQIVRINGQSDGYMPGGQLIATTPGGLLANVANIGRSERDGFSAVPEAELKIRYRWTDRFYTYFGYNYLIWQHVAMSGNQFSRTVNPGNVPTSGVFNAGTGAVGSAQVRLTDLNLDSISLGFVWTY